MNKSILVIAALALLALLIFFQFGNKAPKIAEDVAVKPEQPDVTTNTATAAVENPQLIDVVSLNHIETDEHTQQQTSASKNKSSDAEEILDYEDDWCFKKQLSESDKERAEQEIADWKATTGNRLRYWNAEQQDFTPHAKDPRLPYLELSVQELLRHVDNEEPGAMLAAMDNDEISYDLKDKIAKELLVLGYTGTAITHLILMEQSNTESEFRINGFSEKTKQHLRSMLMYATYSLNLHDAGGFSDLTILTHGLDDFAIALNPTLALIDDDFEKIALQADALHQEIASKRQERGLPPIKRNLSKAAQYKINVDVALMYEFAPEMAEVLASRYEHLYSQLANSECREIRTQKHYFN